jgi:hypothetical protein
LAAEREQFFTRTHGFGQVVQVHGKGISQVHGGLKESHHGFENGLRQVRQVR